MKKLEWDLFMVPAWSSDIWSRKMEARRDSSISKGTTFGSSPFLRDVICFCEADEDEYESEFDWVTWLFERPPLFEQRPDFPRCL